MGKLTNFGPKNSLTLPSLANKYFNSLIDEKDEPFHTYNVQYMRHFVRQSIREGRCLTLNEDYKSITSDEVHNNVSKELDVNGNVCEI